MQGEGAKAMHVIVADDHPLVLDALKACFKQLGPDTVIDGVGDLNQALDHADRAESLDLVVLDINMPGMNGLKGLETIKARFPDVPVVLLSGDCDAELVRKGLAHGAAGFLPKKLAGPAMIKAIELVLCGETYVPRTALEQGTVTAGGPRGLWIGQGSALARLTPRELQILGMLCKGHSNKGIARELGLKSVTVAFHLKGVFRKLGVASRTEAALLAARLGLAEPPSETSSASGARKRRSNPKSRGQSNPSLREECC